MTAHPTLALWIDTVGAVRAEAIEQVAEIARQARPGGEIFVLRGAQNRDGWQKIDPTRVKFVDLPETTGPESELSDAQTAVILNRLLAETGSDWIVWIQCPARLADGAIQTIEAATRRFDADLIYGDGELPNGRIVRRPAFSPVRLRSQDYLGDVRAVRVAALEMAGGFSHGPAAVQPLAVALCLGLEPDRVLRIPQPLAVSPNAVAAATPARQRVVAAFLRERGIVAALDLESGPNPRLRVRYPLVGQPLVSIIIPTRGGRATIHGERSVLVVDAVRGILARSSYPEFEFVIVADDQTPQAVIHDLIALAGNRLRLVRWSEKFNFSAKINRGALFAAGEYLILLNDDVDVVTSDWIEALLGLAAQPGVGMVGSLLLFEDATVQHGGHLYSAGWAGHVALGWTADQQDALDSLAVEREVSGVTAACAMIRADTFWEVGGLSLDYASNYNDVDLSLKIRATGRSVLWSPHARLYHFESKSRDATVTAGELAVLRGHWGTRLQSDPFWPGENPPAPNAAKPAASNAAELALTLRKVVGKGG